MAESLLSFDGFVRLFLQWQSLSVVTAMYIMSVFKGYLTLF